jgi:putative sterol carrier protein
MRPARKSPVRKTPARGLSDIRTTGDIATSRLSPQAAYMKVASLELEKKILEFIKNSSISRMAGIKRLCGEIDDRLGKIGERESTLTTVAMRGVPQLSASAPKTSTSTPEPGTSAPKSCKEIFEEMPSRFKKEAAQEFNAVYQFDLDGEGGGKWYLAIQDGGCEIREGQHSSPSITIAMRASDFVALIGGKLNPQMAFMTGKIKVNGDIGLATKLAGLFDTNRSPAPPSKTPASPAGIPALRYGRR